MLRRALPLRCAEGGALKKFLKSGELPPAETTTIGFDFVSGAKPQTFDGTKAADAEYSDGTRSISNIALSKAQQNAAMERVGWKKGEAWVSIGDEFKVLDEDKFLKPVPEGFLTPRAVTDAQPAEALMAAHIEHQQKTYDGLDVRDPSTVAEYDGHKPSFMTYGDQVRAVTEFISGHIAHQVSLPEWTELFDLKHLEMDVMYWLWILHLHLVARRATSVPINVWARRRECLEELLLTMYASWNHTSEEIMGRPPLTKIKDYVKDMYYVTAVNIEEAMMFDGPGSDMMLMGMLVKFCPLPRPEDVPMFTYYTLVHYIRFHAALFDRISDEQFAKGNFNFLPPNDRTIFASYTDVDLDRVIRSWKAEGFEDVQEGDNMDATERARAEKRGEEDAAAAAETAEGGASGAQAQ